MFGKRGNDGGQSETPAFRPAGTPAPAPAAPRDLVDELRKALGGEGIAGIERAVGVEHADQRHAGEMMPLGQHLRAHQQAHLTLARLSQAACEAAAAAGRIAIDAQGRYVREQRRQGVAHTLGAGADRPVVGVSGGAVRRHRLLAQAVVAQQPATAAVKGERPVAAAAGGHVAAFCAAQRRRKAATVQEQQHLIAPVQMRGHSMAQRGADAAIQALAAHVD